MTVFCNFQTVPIAGFQSGDTFNVCIGGQHQMKTRFNITLMGLIIPYTWCPQKTATSA